MKIHAVITRALLAVVGGGGLLTLLALTLAPGPVLWIAVALYLLTLYGVWRSTTELLGLELDELSRAQEARIAQRTAELEAVSRAAEIASRHRSEFLANMSHELRTPLNAIIGYSEMLQEDARDEGLADFAQDLDRIHRAGRHLHGLINDVLDLSRIQAGRMEVRLEDFDVREMVDEVLDTVRPLADSDGNTLRVTCGELGQMHADITRVRQCLFNLLSNATKFTHGGEVTVEVQRTERRGEDWLTFEVRDTGVGMTPAQCEIVFDAFRQADASTTRRYGGTGLGLAISRQFCELMGGSITVRSTLGQGSTFTIALPAHVELEPATASDVSLDDTAQLARKLLRSGTLAHAREGALVLVIDDDPSSRDLLQRHLIREGFDVRAASSGEDGLRVARELRPAVITLDVMMPGMDGWAVLRALKSDPQLRDTPVVMCTIVNDRSMGTMLGVSDYLLKPVDQQTLGRVLRKHQLRNPPLHVLVVDDEPDMRELLSRMLSRRGWTVTEARNGTEALERTREQTPDLVILDLMMPGMDGFDFLVEFRRDPANHDVPVAVHTAKDLTPEDRRRLDGQAQTVLTKGSYTRDELARVVSELAYTPRAS